MLFLAALLGGFVAFGVAQYQLHRRRLRRIPVRVLVNGTRGKSSVTRLIAAGLRAANKSVIAKTTGTLPRYITSDTEEEPIRRLGKPNIIENLRIISQAARSRPDAVVLECMALVPQYQWTDAHRLTCPTHAVVTNARADHLDVMGPTVRDVANALANTVPDRARFYTAEQEFYAVFAERARQAGTEIVRSSAEDVSDAEMRGFRYVEHKENVALALAVCTELGIGRTTALAGMHRSRPDPGAMRIFRIADQGKLFELVNTLAANDPDSIAMLWRMIKGRCRHHIVLVNCRADRTDRSRQLAELCAGRIQADSYVVSGGLSGVFLRRAQTLGIPADRLVDAGDRPVAKVYAALLGQTRKAEDGTPDVPRKDEVRIPNRQDARDAREWSADSPGSLVFATGNIVGYGSELMNYITSKGTEIAY